MHPFADLIHTFDSATATLDSGAITERRLSDLAGVFVDEQAFAAAVRDGDPVVYTVQGIAPAEGAGALNYALGTLHPGRVGDEFYMTKGHLHAWRPAAEVYIGLSGEGLMLLEDEETGQSQAVPLRANGIVYVPGSTAHRTINTGTTPLVYLGIYPSDAGHDYAAIAERNFRQIVVGTHHAPVVADRAAYLLTHHEANR